VKESLSSGKLIRNEITPDNLTQVYYKWVDDIGKHIEDVDKEEYPLLFFADIMSEGKIPKYKDLPAKLCYEGDDTPFFVLHKQRLDLNDTKGYDKFWSIYNKPPKEEHRNYLLSRRDSLIYTEERMKKGAYYTPLKVVDKAYDKLTEVLGAGWQKEYFVWDMCCGVGNLEMKHSNHRNIFMSTLDKADIDIIKSNHTCPEATVFQYDYLNDDVTDDGKIDYSKTKKIPMQLKDAIKSNKKILVLINPPYAEAGSTLGKNSKQNVSKTKVSKYLMDGYGKSSNELFTQFLVRIQKEIPNCTIGVFSKLKYVNAPNFELFRNKWKADYLGGFVVRSKAFDDLKGEFPIGFLIWKSNIKSTLISDVRVDVLDKDCKYKGEKYFYNKPSESFLNVWVERPKANKTVVVPLKNAVSIYDKNVCLNNWSDNAIGYMWCQSNDFQKSSNMTALFSSVWGDGHGFYITEKNLLQSAMVFTARRVIKPTWLNDRDQFLQPNKKLSKEFQNDCLVWMLFNGSNLTASADNLKWNGKDDWKIVNHFIPFKPSEVGSNTGWESYFMVDFMENLKFSKEATQVLAEGKNLWKEYFSETDVKKVRDDLKLNRPDVGWYQIRKALENRGISFDNFQTAYQKLTNKLQEQVYEYGFLMP